MDSFNIQKKTLTFCQRRMFQRKFVLNESFWLCPDKIIEIIEWRRKKRSYICKWLNENMKHSQLLYQHLKRPIRIIFEYFLLTLPFMRTFRNIFNQSMFETVWINLAIKYIRFSNWNFFVNVFFSITEH